MSHCQGTCCHWPISNLRSCHWPPGKSEGPQLSRSARHRTNTLSTFNVSCWWSNVGCCRKVHTEEEHSSGCVTTLDHEAQQLSWWMCPLLFGHLNGLHMELLPLSYQDSRYGCLCSSLELTLVYLCFDRYHDYSTKSSTNLPEQQIAVSTISHWQLHCLLKIQWNKFRELVPLLTNKDISLKVRGRLYSGCVRSSTAGGQKCVIIVAAALKRQKNNVFM